MGVPSRTVHMEYIKSVLLILTKSIKKILKGSMMQYNICQMNFPYLKCTVDMYEYLWNHNYNQDSEHNPSLLKLLVTAYNPFKSP